MTELYCSTVCLPRADSLSTHLRLFSDHGISQIEVGSFPGVFEEELLGVLREFSGKVLFHNYYVSTLDDLVLNLASPSDERRKATITYMKRGIELSKQFGAKWYSFHGGFVHDPIGRDALGFTFPEVSDADRGRALERFKAGIIELLDAAKKNEVALLIENNVCAAHNAGKLLMVSPGDFLEFFENNPECSDARILLDTGHLKVSADVLGFQRDDILILSDRIEGVHLHDNDGTKDQHLPPGAEMLDLCKSAAPRYVSLEARYSSPEGLVHAVESCRRHFS